MVSSPEKADTSMNSVEPRQMEIGEENIDGAKAIAGRDEDRGFGAERLDGAVFGRGALQ